MMVRLDRITMQGFKSFAGRITIPFPSGFNAIAGPNGSGKSNCVDAITFVLGETSARVIRAQKLRSLIFNGGKDRKPADFCEVSLYLDNSDQRIPGEKEIKITRRITRSGISIYKLDGRTVTRAKILDIISYAGLSAEGYNIIMQGDVTRIIEMSPLERRGIIDDISGISEFDEKKEKAVKELEHVDLRVRESMIVAAEKQKLVARLKQEKETAEKYVELNKEMRKSKASLLKKRMEDSGTRLETLEKEIKENTKKFDGLEKEFQKIEGDMESKEKALKKINDEILSRSRNIEIARKIDSLATEILRKKDKIDMNRRELERLQSLTSRNRVVEEILKVRNPNVFGTVGSLISVPKAYSTAIEASLGKHDNDIVVRDDDTGAVCIKYLKEKKLGRARFLPLNKIKPRREEKYNGKEKIIGYATELIKFDKKYEKAISFVLVNTLVVDNIDTARRIDGFRIVTLDGDIVERSGAMIGGFYKKSQVTRYSNEAKDLQSMNDAMEEEIEKLEKEAEKLKGKEKEESEDVKNLQKERDEMEALIESQRKRRKTAYEERVILQNRISKDRIDKARLEAGHDNVAIEYKEFSDVTEFYNLSEEELQERVKRAIIEINKLGPINLRAIDEFFILNVEFEELKKKLDFLLEEKDAIMKVVADVEQKRYSKFTETFNSVVKHFSKIYTDLTGGGTGRLRLEEENNIDSGLVIEASPLGKKILNLDVMSGGEKTLTSLAFLFAIMQHNAAPFYILDEVDAALDKANTNKIANLIKMYSKDVQFIVITHNDITISQADKVFGVSMENSVSKVFGIEMPAA